MSICGHGVRAEAYQRASVVARNTAPPTDAPMMTALCCWKNDPSGSLNLSTLRGSCDTLGGFAGL